MRTLYKNVTDAPKNVILFHEVFDEWECQNPWYVRDVGLPNSLTSSSESHLRKIAWRLSVVTSRPFFFRQMLTSMPVVKL